MIQKTIIYLLLILTSFQVKAQLLPLYQLNNETSYTSLEEAKKDSSKVFKLTLKRKKFKTIPAEIWNMTNLQYLDLSKNKIDSIPPQIKNLKNLQVLILSKNKISNLPEEFYQLKNLKVIRIGSNDVGYLSKQVRDFKKLEELDLWNTNVSELPFELSKLPKLKLLDLRGILLNVERQEDILELYSETKVLMSLPCNCSF
jgi:Leucine-rich repeat (LRR) protein